MQKSIPLKVMSFNMKRNYFAFGDNRWAYRTQLIAAIIKNNKPDIIGTQELTAESLNDMLAILPEYSYVGNGRNGEDKGEYTAVFYLKDKFEVEAHSTFWLSSTPQKPSRAWMAAFPRICTTCTLSLKDNSNQKINIFNTHLDHLSYLARINGLKLITRKMEEQYEKCAAPVLLMGDFNATPSSKTLTKWCQELLLQRAFSLEDAYAKKHGERARQIGRSYHGFKGKVVGKPIDYIFASHDIEIQDIEICRDKINERFPSDHYPVVARLGWACR
ncbi:MAG: endonuclease/exonuclease/phosphatase family protein [Niameybacter sp.]